MYLPFLVWILYKLSPTMLRMIGWLRLVAENLIILNIFRFGLDNK